MCGRFSLSAISAELATLFDLDDFPDLPARYNIAPTQPVIVVRQAHDSDRRQVALMRWGLIPSWAKDISIGSRMINARAESVAEKPSFGAAFKRRRCLIPASGFFEWQKRGSSKQPYFIGMEDLGPFALAGLWEYWEGADGSALETTTILTTTPNDLVKPLHNRMPVILHPQDFPDWLHPATPADALIYLLRPYPAAGMIAYPVSTLVNSPANDHPECVEPLA